MNTFNRMKANPLTVIHIFVFLCLQSTVSPAQNADGAAPAASSISVVVIDPGHGGRDSGAKYGNAREKNIVLDIALKLGTHISDAYPGIKVIYTRNKDEFVPLYKRADIANKNNANLFISIHVNAVEQSYVQGTETFILGQHRTEENLEVAKKENKVILLEEDYNRTYEGFDPHSPESYIMFELVQDEYLEQSAMLASAIQNQFRDQANRIDRSVKQAGFLVLRHTTMPSVLVETGFISHSADRKYLMSENGRNHLAWAIFSAFRNYKKNVEKKSAFHLVTEETDGKKNNPSGQEEGTSPPGKTAPKAQDLWFSVQLVALSTSLETIPENFKGETEVFQKNSGELFRYFTGKFNSVQNARKEERRLRSKFKGAFVVAFEDNELISLKKALRKM